MLVYRLHQSLATAVENARREQPLETCTGCAHCVSNALKKPKVNKPGAGFQSSDPALSDIVSNFSANTGFKDNQRTT
jgi:hypothetical protein